MKIALGSDHAGYERKKELIQLLTDMGHKVADIGTHSEDSVDYPDYARRVARTVALHQADKGILICGTGIGMCISANKVPGIRAAVCWNAKVAALAAEHNQANVLCLSARFVSSKAAAQIVKAWLKTPFAGGRHLRRVQKISKIEKEICSKLK